MNGLIFLNLPKFGPKFAKIYDFFFQIWVILLKIWPKIGLIDIWMGHFILKNWYLNRSNFKFHGGTNLPKPNLSTPRYFDKEVCTTVWQGKMEMYWEE